MAGCSVVGTVGPVGRAGAGPWPGVAGVRGEHTGVSWHVGTATVTSTLPSPAPPAPSRSSPCVVVVLPVGDVSGASLVNAGTTTVATMPVVAAAAATVPTTTAVVTAAALTAISRPT